MSGEEGIVDQSVAIRFLMQSNFMVNFTLGITANHVASTVTVLDTGVGPNLVSANILSSMSLRGVQPCTLKNQDVNILPLSVSKTIDLVVIVDNLKVHVRFIVVDQLATQCTPGTTFTDPHFRAIFLLSHGPVQKRAADIHNW